MPEFDYSPMLPTGPDETPYRLLTTEGIDTFTAGGRTFLTVEPETLRALTETAVHDMEHFLRPGHLAQLRAILDDPEASPNDRFVALDLLRNVNISAGGVLPMCQDTGTAIISAKRGARIITAGNDEEHLSHGIFDAYERLNLRYSQLSPVTMWEEKNTGTNLPAQIEVEITSGRRSWTSVGLGLVEGIEVGAAEGIAAPPGVALATAVLATTVRTTAAIGSGSVPKGKRARSIPFASTRKTSAVWDME